MVGSDYVGVVRIDIAGDVAFLRRVAIDERWQRKGHGRTLVELAEAFAGDAGAWSVESDVAPDAVEFYRKCGYEPLEPKSASPSVHMRKHLRAR
jgi:GNAT superfamily N-acetyltransferase